MRRDFEFRAIFAVILIAGAAFGCKNDKGPPPDEKPTFTLNGAQPADDPGSCSTCHPRQFREWAGSSHNYGQALDPGYQSLEVTGNYLAHFRFGKPVFRQNFLCITCHAPSVGGYEKGQDGVYRLNPNAQFRPNPANTPVGKELRKPDNSEAVLEPPGRAAEFIADPNNGAAQIDDPALTMDQILKRRRISFQGITCETCHKTGRPFDDLQDDDPGAACHDKTPECAAMLRAQCEQKDDPRCRRITREQHGFENVDRFDFGISNFALSYQRDGAARFGPFPVGHVATNIAHDVNSGETDSAQNYHVEFPGQPEDVRPYIKTAQFCGACHDVRLGADNLLTTDKVEIEPVHNEPFIRLENLFTEFYISPLNLHPKADPRDNPFLDDNNNPIRLACQDCHMSLFPYAPPRTFPGTYTAQNVDCDDRGRCGSFAALQTAPIGPNGENLNVTTNELQLQRRPRVTTHYMTGVDVALGHLVPEDQRLGYDPNSMLPTSLQLPNQVAPQNDSSPDYNVPISLDARREQQLKTAVHINLSGTPESVDPADRDCSDGSCCDAQGNCNLPVKVWVMNVNGGHNVAAGFSQERQVWVELTVQDMGKMGRTGMPKVVDCPLADIDDLYTSETLVQGRYPRWTPKPHDALEATDLFDRLYGVPTSSGAADPPDDVRAMNLCRGISGHLVDKPHFETHELEPDGSLNDEDVGLHRIGNALPALDDGRYLLSWHVLDYGLDKPLDDPTLAKRVDRPDQFHTVGNRAYSCELSRRDADPDTTPDAARHGTFEAGTSNYPVVIYDPRSGTTSSAALSSMHLKHAVTETSDDRFEILYPFPEFKPFLPKIDAQGVLEPGERSGLVYPTNVFYRVCGCPDGNQSCEGPKTISDSDAPAQVQWLKVWPTLPAKPTAKWPWYDSGVLPAYDNLLNELGVAGGVTRAEAFTFVPFNSNHMPNNHSLVYFKPQRHYYDIRFKQSDVVGPLRVHVKVWYRHFPPEFLRLMARSTEQLFQRAKAAGKEMEYFPNGPLVTEGELAKQWPNAGHIDNLRRIMLDEAVSFVAVKPDQVKVPDQPTFANDVAPIIHDHCLPCHGDILRHGRLVLAYDAFPQWDDPAQGPKVHSAQDPVANVVNKASTFLADRKLVIPGDPDASYLMDVLTKDKPDATNDRVRRMPLKMDPLSPREIDTVRKWIAGGAQR